MNKNFTELSAVEMNETDGGVALLTAVLICGGCFLAGAGATVGISALLD